MKNNKNTNPLPSSLWSFKPIMVLMIMILALMAAFVSINPAIADEGDQIRAREALLNGEIRPLSELLEKVEAMYSGDILEVELEEEEIGFIDSEEILIYEIKLLTPQGNVVKLEFDAKNLKLLDVYGHDPDKARKNHDDDDD